MDKSETNSIFVKQSEIKRPECKLDYNEIIKSIPDEAVENELPEYRKTHNEWRWRFLDINGKKTVEISMLNKGEPTRKYINKYGQMVEYTVDPQYDQYVTKTLYYYTSE